MKRKLILSMVFFMLLFTLSHSQEISLDTWVKFDDEEYELETDDGFKLKIKSDGEFELETPDGSSSFTIISSVPIYEVGDITQTKEWGYRELGTEYVSSDKKIMQDGNTLCIEEDKTISGEGLLQQIYYHNCIEYPPQYVNITEFIMNETYPEGFNHNYQVNVINITKITDFLYEIPHLIDYDPTSTGLTTGLVLSYTFDDTEVSGSMCVDLVNGYNMTIVGATTGVSGVVDESYSYDGNDYLNRTATGTEYDANTGDFTINLWYNTSDITTDQQFFQIWNAAVPNDHIKARWVDGGATDRIYLFTRTATGDAGYCQRKVISTTDDGAFHMFTMILNGTACSDLILYIDNVLIATDLNAADGSNLDLDNMNRLNIGKPETAQWYWKGRIEEFSYWTRELNTTEISDLYNDGDGWQYPFTPDAGDTCTPPASGDYTVDCSDACTWSSSDTIPANITMSGSGTVALSSDWTFTGSSQHIYINSGCTFNIESGGEFK